MKTTLKTVLIITITALFSSCGGDKEGAKTSFYVRGNCGMCEERIEKAANDLPGVLKADWDVKTKNLSVTYDSTKVNESKIQYTIANVGHETKTVQSPQAVHDGLPMCCKKDGGM